MLSVDLDDLLGIRQRKKIEVEFKSGHKVVATFSDLFAMYDFISVMEFKYGDEIEGWFTSDIDDRRTEDP